MAERNPFEEAAPEREGPAPIVAVVPAAGSGTRLAGERPKQYLMLGERALIEHTLAALFAVPRISAVVVALAPDDAHFATLDIANDPRVRIVTGGETRAESVGSALAAVRREHGDDAWALVHDAARPLVAAADIERLIDAVLVAVPAIDAAGVLESGAPLDAMLGGGSGPVAGGILAERVSDTLKRERGGARWSELFDAEDAALEVDETVPRDGLWQAQTPQLFRAGPLADALRAARTARAPITDEASALERQGKRCLLIEAEAPNFKVTRSSDLAMARALLAQRAGPGMPETDP